MITKTNAILLFGIVVLISHAVIQTYGMNNSLNHYSDIPSEIVSTLKFDDYNFNVEYKYGRDSLNLFLQNQYNELFYKENGIEYGTVRVYLIIEFYRRKINKIILFAPHLPSDFDTRIIGIFKQSLLSIRKDDWLYCDKNNKYGAAVSLVTLY